MTWADVFVMFFIFVAVLFVMAYASASVLLYSLKRDGWLTREDLEDIDK